MWLLYNINLSYYDNRKRWYYPLHKKNKESKTTSYVKYFCNVTLVACSVFLIYIRQKETAVTYISRYTLLYKAIKTNSLYILFILMPTERESTRLHTYITIHLLESRSGPDVKEGGVGGVWGV